MPRSHTVSVTIRENILEITDLKSVVVIVSPRLAFISTNESSELETQPICVCDVPNRRGTKE